jgi:hypothetical protein
MRDRIAAYVKRVADQTDWHPYPRDQFVGAGSKAESTLDRGRRFQWLLCIAREDIEGCGPEGTIY